MLISYTFQWYELFDKLPLVRTDVNKWSTDVNKWSLLVSGSTSFWHSLPQHVTIAPLLVMFIQCLNPLTAVLMSGTCHELYARGVPSWQALLFMYSITYMLFMVLQALTIGYAIGTILLGVLHRALSITARSMAIKGLKHFCFTCHTRPGHLICCYALLSCGPCDNFCYLGHTKKG